MVDEWMTLNWLFDVGANIEPNKRSPYRARSGQSALADRRLRSVIHNA
jgi:hypothetical protein